MEGGIVVVGENGRRGRVLGLGARIGGLK